MKFQVTSVHRNVIVKELLDEWPARLKAFVEALPAMLGKDLLDAVKQGAPSDIEGYPDMLRLVRFQEIEGWGVVGAVPPGWAFSQRLRSVDVKRTVLYVRPKVLRGIVISQAAVVLERNNPWTLGTLPYEPKRHEASLMSRRVSEREATEIEKRRQADMQSIRNELRGLPGVQLRPEGDIKITRRVSRDIAFEVVRREFGYNMPGKAHWRPATRQLREAFLKRAMAELFPWVSDPSNTKWKSGADDLPQERAGVAKRVQDFQDLVAR